MSVANLQILLLARVKKGRGKDKTRMGERKAKIVGKSNQ